MSSPGRDDATAGAVLAGGRSSRMGAPKAGIELAGRALISYPIDALRGAGLEPLVVAKPDSELPELDCRVVREADPRTHPATGILAALDAAGGAVVVVACDIPFVPAQLLMVLGQIRATIAVPIVDGCLQPLLARYERSAMPDLERAVERGAALREAIQELDPLTLGPDELAGFGDPDLIAFNVNDRADLAAAERLMAAVPRR